jgi:hypothetical protein
LTTNTELIAAGCSLHIILFFNSLLSSYINMGSMWTRMSLCKKRRYEKERHVLISPLYTITINHQLLPISMLILILFFVKSVCASKSIFSRSKGYNSSVCYLITQKPEMRDGPRSLAIFVRVICGYLSSIQFIHCGIVCLSRM